MNTSHQTLVSLIESDCFGVVQATGEAQYTDDIPPYSNELHGVIVFSTKAHAKVLSGLLHAYDWSHLIDGPLSGCKQSARRCGCG